jgi:hypothetical protein
MVVAAGHECLAAHFGHGLCPYGLRLALPGHVGERADLVHLGVPGVSA